MKIQKEVIQQYILLRIKTLSKMLINKTLNLHILPDFNGAILKDTILLYLQLIDQPPLNILKEDLFKMDRWIFRIKIYQFQ